MAVIIQHPGLRRTRGPVSPGQLLALLSAAASWERDLLPVEGPELGPHLRQALLRWALCSGVSEVQSEGDTFAINLDVKHFLPEELAVRVRGDFLEIQGRHGERQDAHGCVSREFCRRYQLPPDVDRTALTCSLSPDGTLACSGPRVAAREAPGTVLGPARVWPEPPRSSPSP